jgi:hypothetical protein
MGDKHKREEAHIPIFARLHMIVTWWVLLGLLVYGCLAVTFQTWAFIIAFLMSAAL